MKTDNRHSNVFKYVFLIIMFFLIMSILIVSIKGTNLKITSDIMVNKLQNEGMPFELTHERSSFALTSSIVDNHSVFFTNEVAKYLIPDLGYYGNKFVSIFPPGVSVYSIPLYIVGKYFGNEQVFTFLTSTIAAFLNCLLIYKIVKKLTDSGYAGVIAALAFIFGTSAYSYATTLYQHHFVSLALLSGIYLLLKKDSLFNTVIIFLITGLVFFVEYQSILFYLPVLIVLFINNIRMRDRSNKMILSINNNIFIALIFLLLSFLPFLYYNKVTYGKFFQLAGTVQGTRNSVIDPLTGEIIISNTSADKTVSGFFNIYKLPRSMSVLLTSKDRGILYFSPIIIFSIFGIAPLMRRKKSIALSVISISVLIITLYGMWGDPWGGWAFGIRYMIPAFAVLSIPLGIAIKEYGKKWFFVIPFIIIFIYSVFINLAGALTTNKIPPSVEVDSERYPTYTFIHNIKLALDGKTSSYIYNTYLENINFRIFFFTLFAIIISLILINYLLLRLESKNNHDQKDH